MRAYNMPADRESSGNGKTLDSESAAVLEAGRRNGVDTDDLDAVFLLAFLASGDLRMADLSPADAARVRAAVGG